MFYQRGKLLRGMLLPESVLLEAILTPLHRKLFPILSRNGIPVSLDPMDWVVDSGDSIDKVYGSAADLNQIVSRKFWHGRYKLHIAIKIGSNNTFLGLKISHESGRSVEHSSSFNSTQLEPVVKRLVVPFIREVKRKIDEGKLPDDFGVFRDREGNLIDGPGGIFKVSSLKDYMVVLDLNRALGSNTDFDVPFEWFRGIAEPRALASNAAGLNLGNGIHAIAVSAIYDTVADFDRELRARLKVYPARGGLGGTVDQAILDVVTADQFDSSKYSRSMRPDLGPIDPMSGTPGAVLAMTQNPTLPDGSLLRVAASTLQGSQASAVVQARQLINAAISHRSYSDLSFPKAMFWEVAESSSGDTITFQATDGLLGVRVVVTFEVVNGNLAGDRGTLEFFRRNALVRSSVLPSDLFPNVHPFVSLFWSEVDQVVRLVSSRNILPSYDSYAIVSAFETLIYRLNVVGFDLPSSDHWEVEQARPLVPGGSTAAFSWSFKAPGTRETLTVVFVSSPEYPAAEAAITVRLTREGSTSGSVAKTSSGRNWPQVLNSLDLVHFLAECAASLNSGSVPAELHPLLSSVVRDALRAERERIEQEQQGSSGSVSSAPAASSGLSQATTNFRLTNPDIRLLFDDLVFDINKQINPDLVAAWSSTSGNLRLGYDESRAVYSGSSSGDSSISVPLAIGATSFDPATVAANASSLVPPMRLTLTFDPGAVANSSFTSTPLFRLVLECGFDGSSASFTGTAMVTADPLNPIDSSAFKSLRLQFLEKLTKGWDGLAEIGSLLKFLGQFSTHTVKSIFSTILLKARTDSFLGVDTPAVSTMTSLVSPNLNREVNLKVEDVREDRRAGGISGQKQDVSLFFSIEMGAAGGYTVSLGTLRVSQATSAVVIDESEALDVSTLGDVVVSVTTSPAVKMLLLRAFEPLTVQIPDTTAPAPSTSSGPVSSAPASGSASSLGTTSSGTFLLTRPYVPAVSLDFVTLPTGISMTPVEITQAQWRAVMGSVPSGQSNTASHAPVTNVSWHEAMEFCSKTGTRLPTEAEWEAAYRAGTNTTWYNGDDTSRVDEIAWIDSNSKNSAQVVGQKLPNAWGLYDMAGNVWEWCADQVGLSRVIRGGSWGSDASGTRAAARGSNGPDGRNGGIGFRVVKDSSGSGSGSGSGSSSGSSSGAVASSGSSSTGAPRTPADAVNQLRGSVTQIDRLRDAINDLGSPLELTRSVFLVEVSKAVVSALGYIYKDPSGPGNPTKWVRMRKSQRRAVDEFLGSKFQFDRGFAKGLECTLRVEKTSASGFQMQLIVWSGSYSAAAGKKKKNYPVQHGSDYFSADPNSILQAIDSMLTKFDASRSSQRFGTKPHVFEDYL